LNGVVCPHSTLLLFLPKFWIRSKGGGSFPFSYNQKLTPLNIDAIVLEYERTRIYWLIWSSKTRRFSRFNDEIGRSALVLKLLTYQKTGAMLSAVTTSLPEDPGAERNWDYRYCWLRDAGMAVSVMIKLGHYRVAKRFLDYVIDVIPFKNERIQIVYGINIGRRWMTGLLTAKIFFQMLFDIFFNPHRPAMDVKRGTVSGPGIQLGHLPELFPRDR